MPKKNTISCEIDYSKLRGRIKEICKTETIFSSAIGRSRQFVSDVFNERTYFDYEDIFKACAVLQIESSEVGTYFFKKKVHKE